MDLDFLQTPRLQALQQQAEAAEKETDKRKFLVMLVREIISAIQEKTIATIEGGVDVNNLDTITASLRNELNKANKPIRDLLTKINLSTEQQTEVIKQMEEKAINDFNSQYQTVIVKRVRDQVEVSNLHEISLPVDIRVNNLSDLAQYFQDVAEKISSLDLIVNVPAPQVTVQPTPVHIPQTIIPEVNLEPLAKEIERGLKLLRTNNKSNPLAVRLTDGSDWIKEFKKLNENNAKQVQFMSDVSYIRDASGLRINPATSEGQAPPSSIGDGTATVATAGTRVQLSATSVSCKRVIIVGNTANAGKVYVGGITVATGRGRPLNQEQSETININDLSKVYIDADNNGDGVSFAYEA